MVTDLKFLYLHVRTNCNSLWCLWKVIYVLAETTFNSSAVLQEVVGPDVYSGHSRKTSIQSTPSGVGIFDDGS
jgi:hypothetical protein